MAGMTKCKTCGTDVAQGARACPKCGAQQGMSLPLKLTLGCGALMALGFGSCVVLGAIGAVAGDRQPHGAKEAATTPSAPRAPSPAPAPPAPAETPGQNNARRSAQQYLSTMPFSRVGLINQLSSSAWAGFSLADATYGVDSLNADWNEQAAKSAQQYLSTMPFSRADLIHQLES